MDEQNTNQSSGGTGEPSSGYQPAPAGEPQQAAPAAPQQQSQAQNQDMGTAPQSEIPAEGMPADAGGGVEEHKMLAFIGYAIPFLFFLPLINEKSKNNAFARFHANQQLILLIVLVAISILANVLYQVLMVSIFHSLAYLSHIAWIVFAILGVMAVQKGEMKELPGIGGFKILK